MMFPDFRVGFGYDVHTIEPGRKLFLGGVEFDTPFGLKGHSDADVLIHAICDALLGAANLRDIGYHFPPGDAKFKNIDSKILLKEVVALLQNTGFAIQNIDSTICAEEPKINPRIPEMQKTLGEIMQIDSSKISIKATTNEKIGFVGRKEGICAYAVCLIYKN